MSTRPKFNLTTIPGYILNGPGNIRQVLGDEGPVAASRGARRYSMALCLAVLAVYLLWACTLGFFQVSMMNTAGVVNLQNPSVVGGVLIVGLVDAAAIAVAIWAAVLAIMALFRPEEQKGPAVNALLWGIALAILYAGVFVGLLGYGR